MQRAFEFPGPQLDVARLRTSGATEHKLRQAPNIQYHSTTGTKAKAFFGTFVAIGLQPNSDGLQPNNSRDGLQPNSDRLQPNSLGLQHRYSKGQGLQPDSDGLQPNRDGLQPAMISNLVAMASNLIGMASNLIAMALFPYTLIWDLFEQLVKYDTQHFSVCKAQVSS